MVSPLLSHTLAGLHEGTVIGRLGRIHQKVGQSSVLEVLLAFQWGESFSSFVYLSVPQRIPRETLSSGQEAQRTQKDDYTAQDYLCLPLIFPSMVFPGDGAALAL